jgi:hypothetical protein
MSRKIWILNITDLLWTYQTWKLSRGSMQNLLTLAVHLRIQICCTRIDRETDRPFQWLYSTLCMDITVSCSQTLNKVLDGRHLSFLECYTIQLEYHSYRRHYRLQRRHLVPPKRCYLCYNSVVSPEKAVILTLTTTKTWCEVTEYCWVAPAPMCVPSSATRSP